MKNNIKKIFALLIVVSMALSLAACGNSEPAEREFVVSDELVEAAFIDLSTEAVVNIFDEAAALGGEPALSTMLMPVASGTKTSGGNKAEIDYSNTNLGYVMVRYTQSTTQRLKVQITGPSGVTYTYDLASDNEFDTFPLSDGNGKYKIVVYKNISGTSYSTVHSFSTEVVLDNEFAPFLLPNQYVDYNENSLCVAKARELVAGKTETLDMVKAIYNYVVSNYSYDTYKAATVESGYLPVLDDIYNEKKGICFDYAALATAMLRSIDIPTKLVIGYSGTQYHAWINVYSEESGWMTGVIFFDGETWKLMDPTFASSGRQSASIMSYISNASNYSAKYSY